MTDTTTTTTPMVCYVCGKRIYRKAGAAVIHLFWNRRPGEPITHLGSSEPGWAHAACAPQDRSLRPYYRYPWGEPE